VRGAADIVARNKPAAPAAQPRVGEDLLGTPAAILNEAVEDELIKINPACSRRLSISAPAPARTFLEVCASDTYARLRWRPERGAGAHATDSLTTKTAAGSRGTGAGSPRRRASSTFVAAAPAATGSWRIVVSGG
jgi:hypothetical protein